MIISIAKTLKVSYNLDVFISVNLFLGASPKIWAPRTVNKPDLYQNFDVAGAGPRMLHFELNKPEFNLTNIDIKGSQPCVN